MIKDGHVAELDTPLNLMKDKRSELAQMVEKTGPKNAEILYQIAQNADKQADNDTSGVMLVTAM